MCINLYQHYLGVGLLSFIGNGICCMCMEPSSESLDERQLKSAYTRRVLILKIFVLLLLSKQ